MSARGDPGTRILSLVALLLDRRAPVPFAWIQERLAPEYGPPEPPAGDRAARKEFEAGRRKFLRDKDLLDRLGLRVRFVAGDEDQEGGYVLDGDALHAPGLSLSPAEADAVRLAASLARGLQEFPLGSDLALALAKLQALSEGLDLAPREGHVAAAFAWSHRSAVRAPGLDQVLPLLAEAVADRRALRMDYRALSAAEATARRVDPWGLFLRQGVWHLVGWCHLRQAVRLFDAHRVQAVEVLESGLERPPPAGFDLQAWARREAWELEMHPAVTVVLRLDRAAAGLAATRLRAGRRLPDGPGGALRLAVEATNLDPLLGLVLSLWGHAAVEAPPEAAARFRALAQRVADAHRGEVAP